MVSVDARSNLLTVETREGDRVSYNPALLKQQTDRSTVYTEGSRELAQGERIHFNTANPELRIRAGSLATVEKFGEDNAITVRLDNGKTVELDGDQSRYIDYGYAVEAPQQASVDRILLTGTSQSNCRAARGADTPLSASSRSSHLHLRRLRTGSPTTRVIGQHQANLCASLAGD